MDIMCTYLFIHLVYKSKISRSTEKKKNLHRVHPDHPGFSTRLYVGDTYYVRIIITAALYGIIIIQLNVL